MSAFQVIKERFIYVFKSNPELGFGLWQFWKQREELQSHSKNCKIQAKKLQRWQRAKKPALFEDCLTESWQTTVSNLGFLDNDLEF